MDKERILKEIRRTAESNNGKALGSQRFETETGIRKYDWFGKYWARWNDAVSEAGLQPNSMNEAYEETFLIEKLVELTQKLQRIPAGGDILLEAKTNPDFPNKDAFLRLGLKAQRAARVIAYCEEQDRPNDVAELWRKIIGTQKRHDSKSTDHIAPNIGYVYLVKHGLRSHYKIGKTLNPLRREGEIALQLPEKLKPIHYIETDDPSGIESYWHRRFAAKRKEGEWFELTASEVSAFKRWKRIY